MIEVEADASHSTCGLFVTVDKKTLGTAKDRFEAEMFQIVSEFGIAPPIMTLAQQTKNPANRTIRQVFQ